MRRQGIFPGRNVRDKYFPGKGSYDSLPIWPSNIWLIATPLLKHPPYSWNNVLSFVFLRTESLSSSVPYLNFITKKNPYLPSFTEVSVWFARRKSMNTSHFKSAQIMFWVICLGCTREIWNHMCWKNLLQLTIPQCSWVVLNPITSDDSVPLLPAGLGPFQ